MTSTNQTSLILLSLDKALMDNCDRLNRQEQQSLTQAVLNVITGRPVAETTNKPRKENKCQHSSK